MIADEAKTELRELVRKLFLPLRNDVQIAVMMRDFPATLVRFRYLRTAAMVALSRQRKGFDLPVHHGTAFLFAGKSRADEAEVIRLTAGGRNADGKPYPIPPDVYEKVLNNPGRPLVALTLWDPESARDPSMLVIANTIGVTFFEAVGAWEIA